MSRNSVTCTKHSKKTSKDCLLQKHRLITRKIIFIVAPCTLGPQKWGCNIPHTLRLRRPCRSGRSSDVSFRHHRGDTLFQNTDALCARSQPMRPMSHRLFYFAFCCEYFCETVSRTKHEDVAYCYRCFVVCVSVCCLRPRNWKTTKTDKPLELSFGVMARAGSKNYVLGGGPDPLQ